MSDATISNRDVKCSERMQQNSKGDTNIKRLVWQKGKKKCRKVKKWLLSEEILDSDKKKNQTHENE